MNGDQEKQSHVLLTHTGSITEVFWAESGSYADEAYIRNNPLLTCQQEMQGCLATSKISADVTTIRGTQFVEEKARIW